MRKFITYLLLLAMILSLFACGKNNEDPTESTAASSSYTSKDLLLYQAAQMAQQLGLGISEGYLSSRGVSAEIERLARAFLPTKSTAEIQTAALLRMDQIDLELIIHRMNRQVNTSMQQDCIRLLQFETQLCFPKTLASDAAIYLRYNEQCQIIVIFERQRDQLVTAKIYPLFADVANALMHKYYPNAAFIETGAIQNALKRADSASCVATPTGATVNSNYYSNMAKAILKDSAKFDSSLIMQYASDSTTLNYISMFTKALSSDCSNLAVYRFPPAKPNSFSSQQAIRMARQQTYLFWPDYFASSFGAQCVDANYVLRSLLLTRMPGIVASESETPVLVVMDFDICTALVCIYPSEYNTYLHSVTCLPCSYDEAVQKLESASAPLMQ